MQATCPLCSSVSKVSFEIEDTYYKCETCHGIFVDENTRPNRVEEKKRYELHDDDTSDNGYRKFVHPITSSIMNDFDEDALGLDFGAGTSAIISVVLKEQRYNIKNYDPYFHIHPELLEKKYDYISSCEVIEHFYNPHKEFTLLKSMLGSNSKLYLMTEVYSEGINFASWYYKNDPTHVFFYSKETFEWIKNRFKFKSVSIEKRLIVFEN
ncbi:class I SAM-dependent methyltransferase [Sulfurimonas sp.]|nr:class I SAM-dependent methyltransferase [Sulfurimonas sp.]